MRKVYIFVLFVGALLFSSYVASFTGHKEYTPSGCMNIMCLYPYK